MLNYVVKYIIKINLQPAKLTQRSLSVVKKEKGCQQQEF